MSRVNLNFESPIHDSISRIRFAPYSNNLLISSWDNNLRLYDVDTTTIRLEAHTESALLDCCFESESSVFSAGPGCAITRYDLHSGMQDKVGSHDDLSTHVEYSDETWQVISAGWDQKIMFWDKRMEKAIRCLEIKNADVVSMSLRRFNLIAAAGEFVYLYDLRSLDRQSQAKELSMNHRIKCICSVLGNSPGFAVGTLDGRVKLEIPNPSSSDNTGYTFRCYPKSKNGNDYLVAVNDIAFNPSIHGVFVTGDNEGFLAAWDSRIKKRLYEIPRCPNSVVSLSFNNGGQLLAVASSNAYQEANEIEEHPQIFTFKVDSEGLVGSEAVSSR